MNSQKHNILFIVSTMAFAIALSISAYLPQKDFSSFFYHDQPQAKIIAPSNTGIVSTPPFRYFSERENNYDSPFSPYTTPYSVQYTRVKSTVLDLLQNSANHSLCYKRLILYPFLFFW